MLHENIDIGISDGVRSAIIAKNTSIDVSHFHDTMSCSMVDIRFSVEFMIYKIIKSFNPRRHLPCSLLLPV